jgi:hypothetical protein
MGDIDDSHDEEDPPFWLAENERQRLWRGPSAEELESALLRMERIEVTRAGDAEDALARVRETLDVVLAQSPGAWPSTEAWSRLAPSWFVWFLADVRRWRWNAQVQDADHLVSETASSDLPYVPYAWGALEWLLYAAGALCSESFTGAGRNFPRRSAR